MKLNKLRKVARPQILVRGIISLLAIGSAQAGDTWTGAAGQNWNDVGNWGGAFPNAPQDAFINLGTGNVPNISADSLFTPRDIFVGAGGGNTGVLNHTAGTASNGGGNWMFVGVSGGTGTYNLADVSSTGGTLTGFGQGSGSMVVGNATTNGRLYVGGRDNGGGGTGTVNVNTTGTLTIRNDLVIGASGGLGVMKVDAGAITTGGWNFIGSNAGGNGGNGTLRMNGGTLTNVGRTYVSQANTTGRIELTGSGKYLNVNDAPFVVGEGTGSNGTVTVNGAGAELLSAGELWIGQAGGGNGTVIVTEGTVSVGNWLAIGRDGGTGVLTINGGLVQKTDADGSMELTNANSATASGTVNLNGGTLRVNNIAGGGGATSTANFYFNGGTLKPTVNNNNFIGGNVVTLVRNGGVVVDTSGFDIGIAKNLTADGASTGGLVKNGAGVLTLSGANNFTGAVTVNAGTLYATTANAANNRAFSFASGISVATGATLRTGSNALFGWDGTQEKPILVNAGGTLTADAGADVGVGTVTLAGGTLANLGPSEAWGSWRFQDATDKLVVTENSTVSAANVKFAGGGSIDVAAGKTLNFTGTITNTTNGGASGLIKAGGTGTLSFSNTNTYSEGTVINAGAVRLSGTGSINGTSGIALNGPGAKLIQNSTVAVTPTVTVTDGTVDGTGTISTVTIANLASNTVANGGGTAGATLTINNLTFQGAANFNLALDGVIQGVQIGQWVTSGTENAITINASNTFWSNGVTYNLIGFTNWTGGMNEIVKGTIGGLGGRQNATLGNNGSAITLAIEGDIPVWTGAGNGVWTTTEQNPKNWILQNNAGTDFRTGDVVVFDDSASGTSVNIGENVSPVSTTFANNGDAYTVGSSGGFGIATGSLTKSGSGNLTLGGAHTYSGATNLAAGSTILTGTLGNTAVTVATGASLQVSAAGAISQNTLTVDGTYSQTVANGLTGSARLVLNTGATLSFSNTHSGGTTLNNGNLNLANGAAIGTGAFTIAGGSLENTSGSAVTLSNANPVRLLSDLNFTGTSALDLGTGAVTLGADASVQTITINNQNLQPGFSLTLGGPISAAAGGTAGIKTLNVNGQGNTLLSGNLGLGGATAFVVNANAPAVGLTGSNSAITTLNVNGGAGSIIELGTGNLTLSNGGGNILQSSAGGTINGTGGGSIVIGSLGGDFGTAGGTTLTVNAKIAGGNRVDFYNANGGPDLGTIVLAAANPITGGVSVENTKVIVPAGGSINPTNAPSGPVLVGTVNNVPATLEVTGGIVNANVGGASVAVGVSNGAAATLSVSDGVVNASSEFWVGNGGGSNGTFNMSGGAVTSGNWFVVGRDFGTGTMNLSGGTITKTAGGFAIFGSLAGTGTVTQTGGALNVTAGGIRLGENNGNTPSVNTVWDMQGGTSAVTGEINVAWRSSQATWNISGNSTVTASGRLIVGGERWAADANGGPVVNGNPVGTINMSGGNVTISGSDSRIGGDEAITNGNSTTGAIGIVNVSGGVLNFGGNLQIGAHGQGSMTVSGTGAVNSTAGFPVVGRFAGGVGTLNINGGTFSQTGATNFLIVGEDGKGTVNLNAGLLDVQELRVGLNPTGDGTLRLNGGTLATRVIQKQNANSTASINFNGGALKAKADSADFLLGVPANSIAVEAGGAIFDTNGFAVTVTQGLAPGAVSGGLTKRGMGTLTLAGTNTYVGPTVVEAGTLAITGSISASETVTVKAGATLNVSGAAGGFQVGSGSLIGGSGTIVGNVILQGASQLAPGESPGVLTVAGDLDIAAAVMGADTDALIFELGTLSDQVRLTLGQLTIGNGELGFDDFVFSNAGGLTSGTYTLFETSTTIIGSLDAFNLEGALPDGFTGTLDLVDGDSDLVLIVVPEPGSAVMLLAGLGSLVGLRRVRRGARHKV